MTEWIDVNDRLPEQLPGMACSDTVLVWVAGEYNTFYSAWYSWYLKCWTVYFDSDSVLYYHDDQPMPVTHWAPVIPPPKKEMAP